MDLFGRERLQKMSDINNDTVTIMDIAFLNTTKDAFMEHYLFPALYREEKRFVVTANPEIVMKAREDNAYKQMIQSADYVVPDGVGILIAAKYKKHPLKERIAGYDLLIDLLAHAAAQDLRCFFLGATDAINEKAVQEAERKFPGLNVVGRHHGFFDVDDPAIAEKVRQTSPDLIFVALGMPKQEEWIVKYKDTFAKGLFMGVGGSLDGLAGEVKRAPDIWIKLNLEWMYRLLKQPFRWKRILKVFEFMARIIFKKDK